MAKKKKDKGAKLTEEERLLQIEQQNMRADEVRKRREEMMRQIMREKLLVEEKNSRLNNLKIVNQWRTIMREAKSAELKKELDMLARSFESDIDRKDAMITSLSKDLEEAEKQYQIALHSHLQNIDNLTELQLQQIGRIESEFEQELCGLQHEFDCERELIMAGHREERDILMDIMYNMEQEFNDQETDARQEFHSLRDEVKNKNLEEKHALRIQLEGTVEELWRQFQNALNNYNSNTEERKQQFEALKLKDQQSAKTIEQQMRKLQRLQESVTHVKTKMSSNIRDCDERNISLKEEREGIGAHFQNLKSQMNGFREGEARRLTGLTLASNKAEKELKRLQGQAERILKLAEMNRKFETEKEKITPFYQSSIPLEEESEAMLDAGHVPPRAGRLQQPNLPHSSAFTADGVLVDEFQALDQFWKRYNKVLLDKLALDKEKNALAEENQTLRSVLKQYLNGISVNDEVISKSNPLFIINGRANINFAPPVGDERVTRPTVVEATHVVMQQSLQ